METGYLFLLAVAPAAFWLWYFYNKDRYEPEPLSWILLVYIFGIVVTIPVAFIEGSLSIIVPEFLIVVLVAPIVEEAGKYLVVKRTVWESLEFDEPVDGIIYAAAAGLGFATLENVIYVFSAVETSLILALQTGLLRALISVPGHVLFSAMWGYSLGKARFIPQEQRTGVIATGLILAMAFHALFNLLLYDAIGFAVLILVVVPVLWFSVQKKIDQALLTSGYRPR
ncbi:MAG TPA: PrsW family glutamic-type intramembrane protease [Methanoregulaceae archaeon]|jgi:RsiW-degrading membrane proteinase PrsW (M82 family)|nr:PrsW family intramembrane metalloprotease [Methanoregulaceae archaeon]MCC7468363.1 PrsW family intramembrane metalloprotease [Burkholderiaceae bacterium]HNB03666.1 PrsW family glutamic-type intramembrane protease [Methanoregulaceae archaeon]HNL86717.1 PrsW family glutamic-type intramembrane protease [Methanoregulaceae archaeon]HNO07812.1 PrsW family glutamic-type intramembrane protease [Methanoregulaceae archaeon]